MTDLTAIDNLDAATVASFLAIIIPALTALVTKWNVSTQVRTIVAFVLSAAAGAVGTLVQPDGGFNWQTFGLTTLYAFIVQVALYVGVYKPQHIAAAIAKATPNFGLGTTRPSSDDGHLVAEQDEEGVYVVDLDKLPEDAQDDGTEADDDDEDGALENPLAEEEAEVAGQHAAPETGPTG